jgi:hypothetical protein
MATEETRDDFRENPPVQLTVMFKDGREETLGFSAPTPSKTSGKMNAHASGKLVLRDGGEVRLNCNITRAKD